MPDIHIRPRFGEYADAIEAFFQKPVNEWPPGRLVIELELATGDIRTACEDWLAYHRSPDHRADLMQRHGRLCKALGRLDDALQRQRAKSKSKRRAATIEPDGSWTLAAEHPWADAVVGGYVQFLRSFQAAAEDQGGKNGRGNKPPTAWEVPEGFIRVSDVMYDSQYFKNGTKLSRQTISYWAARDKPETQCDPASREVCYPVDWINNRWTRWSPRN